MGSNDSVGIKFAQPKTAEERHDIAEACSGALGITMPMVIDTIDDRVGHAYSGMPDRLYVLDKTGRVTYQGGRGPFGFKAGEMEQALILTMLAQERTTPAAESNARESVPKAGQR